MDYRDEVFMTVAENLSFSKASETLFISQPAVTKHIKELEAKLNTTLFDRKGNRISLTKAGKLTYRHLQQIKQQYRDMEFELAQLTDTFKGLVRIGASSTISQYIIPSVIALFHRRYPLIKLDLFNGNSFQMEQKLLNNEIDVALVENESSKAGIKYIDFLDDEIVAVTGSQSIYAKKKWITPTDLQHIPLVLREKGSGTLEVIEKALAHHHLDIENLNIPIHLGSTEAIKNFLYDFEGIALVSASAITKELQLKTITKVSIKDITIRRMLRIALLQGAEMASIKLFIDTLMQRVSTANP